MLSNFKFVLCLWLSSSFTVLCGQNKIELPCRDTVPNAFLKVIHAEERKEVGNDFFDSFLTMTDTLTIHDSSYCNYTLKYITCYGFIGKDSSHFIGMNFCNFVKTERIMPAYLTGVGDSGFGISSNINQFGGQYIVFNYSLITGEYHALDYYFELDTAQNKKHFFNKQ